jgi:putative tryptophan/tyrosine transport system substrate-binding protein
VANLRRRHFMALLGSAAAAAPFSAHAQPTQRRIGVLMFYAASDPEARIRVRALEATLQKLGWAVGSSLLIEYRYAAGDRDLFRVHAADLVQRQEDLILAVSSPALAAVRLESRTIAIVFTQVSDPLGQGVVASIARPSGTVTGFTNYDPTMCGKWVELLKEAAPHVSRAAVLFNPRTAPYTSLFLGAMEAVAASTAVKVTAAPIHDESEIEVALTTHAREEGGGLIVMTDVFTAVHRKQIINLAIRLGLPAMYPYTYYTADGGLMSYGIDQVEQIRGAAVYIDRILKGEKPGDLPVQSPIKFELAINLKTAKALGLNVPPSLLARADEVIE